jgi:hypothetical protein
MGGFDELKLSIETLRELSAEELTEVNGGAAAMTPSCPLTLKVAELVQQVTETTNLTQTTGRGFDL